MLLYNFRRKLYRFLRDNYYFYSRVLKSWFVPKGSKTIFLEVEDLVLNRYLYTFVKFFQLSGYTVYLPENKKIISSLSRNKGEFVYSSWILDEGVKFGTPAQPCLSFSKDQLSNNYFEGKTSPGAYKVPMSEHPAMYKFSVETPEIHQARSRKNSLFMSGNIDPMFYNRIAKSVNFSLPSRLKVYNFLQQKEYYLNIKSKKELYSFIRSQTDNKVIIVDTSQEFRIPLEELKNILVNFNFFLALPGIWIPQSHNIIEAISVGCIPVLHKSYAQQFYPPLQHMKNALIFDSLENLEEVILLCFQLEVDKVETLQKEILDYFDKNLSPRAVVETIERNNFSKIYLQAEERSLH